MNIIDYHKNEIKYIPIEKSFKENIKKNIKYAILPGYLGAIGVKDGTYSLFEVLSSDKYFIFYFDIECIPIDQPDLIYEIVSTLSNFIEETSKINIGRFALTMNTNSSTHEGLSYHLYFPCYKTTQSNILGLLTQFLAWEEYKKYSPYIDMSVYSHNRLFRSPNQKGIGKNGIVKENDVHRVQHGDLSDCIIQNVYYSKLFNYTYTINTKTKIRKISKNDKYIKEDFMKIVKALNPNISSIQTDKDIFNRIINIINGSNLSENHMNFIQELIKYYDEHNNFTGYKLDLQCINALLNTMERLYK